MTSQIIKSASLGFPRMGAKRELKTALEQFWKGNISKDDLLKTAADLRKRHWKLQKDKGIDVIPSNDFSLYDHVLDTAIMVGAIPAEYKANGENNDILKTYFAMARGREGNNDCGCGNHHIDSDIKALEMTKWFDTNYHYIVPEINAKQSFKLQSEKLITEFLEAKAEGIVTRPVLLGPVTFLLLAKCREDDIEPLSLLSRLLPVYQDILAQLKSVGCPWVQMDEPTLVTELNANQKSAFDYAYKILGDVEKFPRIMLTSYFGDVGDNLKTVLSLPVKGYHIDLVRGKKQLDAFVSHIRPNQTLSLGVIDGRNIWRSDLNALIDWLKPVVEKLGTERIQIATSCSLLHVPIDLDLEVNLDDELKSWLSFASQKLDELHILCQALSGNSAAVTGRLAANKAALNGRKSSKRIRNNLVQKQLENVKKDRARRASPYSTRHEKQKAILNLPLFPTTTIGSFPQSADVRKARSDYTKGIIDKTTYESFITRRIGEAIKWQEEVGLDVLVHGEFERNDMVQYFGEQLEGFAFTRHGWVQSYGSRCVRPPIIFGDVSRPRPMTVKWWQVAQSFTSKIVKGMLTGPVTILNWSFVRDDQPREDTCRQIALAIRNEVEDLEKAGAKIIQIDEAALREGLPFKEKDKAYYLEWAVECFRLTQSTVKDTTEIHTHMCYCEFNDIITAIADMDADVISIETSRSKMELLDVFKQFKYPNEIGPGVYDIHSPRVPSTEEILELLGYALQRLEAKQLWVNPDCGLKTRQWEEVKPAIANMVAAAKTLRKTVSV
ncbi:MULTISPECIES: 5-methyltetrahydropteroyltriglutamate--homocysteine S-methyltransferase [Bartonella]|uniref:5-methyltetrahydropteroyltriglutamate-- homocysteine S-methyltransferase n=1 Tax=Bartonella TaxID=773 RepID=UPI0018DE38FE|nr:MULTISPECIES: 5-methyltetrahydropteroyltriglutamate--homocysteine S-methyltransferase [Bartonella]MBH9975778.1 5-methyltetrahydropteroyltriglutamate--homocysteine S-methyltransferase [Bartonella choladocola]MBI0015385.1 5-methyltetrahydropteroyltriglutamate--homocysteine S-methyltransferase [Bartonella sp. B10834G3]